MSWNFPSFSFLKNVSGIQTCKQHSQETASFVSSLSLFLSHLVLFCHRQIADFPSDAVKCEPVVIPLLPASYNVGFSHFNFTIEIPESHRWKSKSINIELCLVETVWTSALNCLRERKHFLNVIWTLNSIFTSSIFSKLLTYRFTITLVGPEITSGILLY